MLLAAAVVACRNYRYEQQLDLLLWKVDHREMTALDGGGGGGCKSAMSKSETSLVSNNNLVRFSGGLSSDVSVCLYRGRVCAVRRGTRDTVVVTRALKKHLKVANVQ